MFSSFIKRKDKTSPLFNIHKRCFVWTGHYHLKSYYYNDIFNCYTLLDHHAKVEFLHQLMMKFRKKKKKNKNPYIYRMYDHCLQRMYGHCLQRYGFNEFIPTCKMSLEENYLFLTTILLNGSQGLCKYAKSH